MVAKTIVSTSFMDMIERLDDETVLCGPDRDPDEATVDPIMASTYKTAIEDFCTDAGIEIDRTVLPMAIRTPLDAYTNDVLSKQDPIATFDAPFDGMIVPAVGRDGTDWGVLALTERWGEPGTYRISGLFSGSTLCVDDTMRGFGLGEALVAIRLLRDGELPTWHHDEPGYSPAGEAVILKALDSVKDIVSALRSGTEQPELARRLSLDLQIEEAAPCP